MIKTTPSTATCAYFLHTLTLEFDSSKMHQISSIISFIAVLSYHHPTQVAEGDVGDGFEAPAEAGPDVLAAEDDPMFLNWCLEDSRCSRQQVDRDYDDVAGDVLSAAKRAEYLFRSRRGGGSYLFRSRRGGGSYLFRSKKAPGGSYLFRSRRGPSYLFRSKKGGGSYLFRSRRGDSSNEEENQVSVIATLYFCMLTFYVVF